MNFVKMHGCGNDYIYIDAISQPELAQLMAAPAWPKTVRALSNRHTGIGADGIILLCPPGSQSRGTARIKAHVRMRMFNADGSEGVMCGNGIRCVAKFAHDRLNMPARGLKVQTGRGILTINSTVRRGRVIAATVDMGKPMLTPKSIGFRTKLAAFRGAGPHWGLEVPGPKLVRNASPNRSPAFHSSTDHSIVIGVPVSMGNPHFVVLETQRGRVDARFLRTLDLPAFGPALEQHPAFADRANIHYVAVASRSHLVMRTWERGSGITLACGTGACAAVVAAALAGRSSRTARVDLPGGSLDIEWQRKSGHVFMTGRAQDVFEGSCTI